MIERKHIIIYQAGQRIFDEVVYMDTKTYPIYSRDGFKGIAFSRKENGPMIDVMCGNNDTVFEMPIENK